MSGCWKNEVIIIMIITGLHPSLKIALVLLIGVLSYYLNFLTFDGFIGGIVVGSPIIIFGGVDWFILLLLFLFIGATLSRVGRERKKEYSMLNEKTGIRGWPNVIANGLWPTLASLFYYFSPIFSVYSYYWLLFFMGSLTSMMADTTATEIGMLSHSLPRLIYNPFKKVERGLSGGVTLLGLLSSFIVSFLFIGFAMILMQITDISFLISILLGSFFGNITDSLLGALLQGKYKCKVCGRVVESSVHCGVDTEKIQGFSWINNHTVNFFASLIGGLLSIFFYVSFL